MVLKKSFSSTSRHKQIAGSHLQRVRVIDAALLARGTHVEVSALRAAIALPRLNFLAAVVAGAGEGGGLRVVQVVQHHHATVLGTSQAVELVVVALAQREECL